MSENHDPEQALQSLGNGAEWVEGAVNVNVGESSSENDSVLQSSEVSTGFSSSESNRVSVVIVFIDMQKLYNVLNMNFPC